MSDRFFTQRNCDRCGSKLKTRTTSWFTTETICGPCSDKETELKRRLRDRGINTYALEGCGYIPEVKA